MIKHYQRQSRQYEKLQKMYEMKSNSNLSHHQKSSHEALGSKNKKSMFNFRSK
jgi:hypothetical protein